jgi:hypothetical protein
MVLARHLSACQPMGILGKIATFRERRRPGGSGFYNKNRSCFILYAWCFSARNIVH